MELKTRYQYTYFIYPYIVKENRYNRYILSLLKNSKCELKIFQKDKDFDVYKYFSPKIREFMFGSFDYNKTKLTNLKELPIETQAGILSKNSCTIFEYNIKKDIQGKTENRDGIFFKINKMQLICFNTGICFLLIKTNVENTNLFSDILNFNYKFRDINQEFTKFNNYDRIRIQTDSFADVRTFREFIRDLTGSNIEAVKLNLNIERFLTYSYTCIDKEYWNSEEDFQKLKKEYIKYINILTSDNLVEYEEEEKIISTFKYSKIGITKQGITLFASSKEINNYTILPDEFEKQYLYNYILALYMKIYMEKLNFEFKQGHKLKNIRRKFIEFTKNLWIQEITSNDDGTVFYHKLKQILELEKIYYNLKNKYDVLYKELNIEKSRKSTIIIALILIASLIFNIMNFVVLINR